MRQIQRSGATSLRQIAEALNARGISAPRGGQWHATSIRNVGHSYAGGLITALGPDYRIASEGALEFLLNEVPIDVPMGAVYCEIIKQAVGPRAATELTLFR
jgi:Recombinase